MVTSITEGLGSPPERGSPRTASITEGLGAHGLDGAGVYSIADRRGREFVTSSRFPAMMR
jgi:hypothetical protein